MESVGIYRGFLGFRTCKTLKEKRQTVGERENPSVNSMGSVRGDEGMRSMRLTHAEI